MMSDDIATLRSCHIHVALMGSKFDEEGNVFDMGVFSFRLVVHDDLRTILCLSLNC